MSEHRKRIGIITGARSEYGLMRPVYDALAKKRGFTPLLFVTGMHLLHAFGKSIRLIDRPIAARIPMYGGAHPIATAANGFARAFKKREVDHVVVLGDRKEMLAAAIAAFDLSIPISHIHSGDETASGHQDELMRRTISALSGLFFAASRKSAERLARIGEERWRIRVAGSPALDSVRTHAFEDAGATRRRLGVQGKRYAVVLFHPNDREAPSVGSHMRTILAAASERGRALVVVYPNNDRGSDKIIKEIEKFRKRRDVRVFKTMPRDLYLDALRHAEFLIGNSSGAFYECSLLMVPAINVGLRNRGRDHGSNVIFAKPTRADVAAAIRRATSSAVRLRMRRDKYLFGRGIAGERIAAFLASGVLERKDLLNKSMRIVQ